MMAGKLRQMITIQHRTVTGQDTFGQDTISWTLSTTGPVYAEAQEGQGREFYRAQQVWAETKVTFRIRYMPSVSVVKADRVVWGTRTLDIIAGYDPTQRKQEYVLVCKELVD